VGTLHVPHTAAGLDQLTSFLRGGGSGPDAAEPVVCVVETNHGLLITALLEVGCTVCPLTLPMAEARGFSRPAGEAHRASAPAPAGSALRDGSAPPEADDGCGGGMVRRASHEATAASSIAQTQEAALSPRLKPGACAPQEKVIRVCLAMRVDGLNTLDTL